MDTRYNRWGKELQAMPVGSLVDYNTNSTYLGPGCYGVCWDSPKGVAENLKAVDIFPVLVLGFSSVRNKLHAPMVHVLIKDGRVGWMSGRAVVQLIQE